MYSFPKKTKQERLSISIPAELVYWVRATAQENNVTISAVIAYAIRQMKAEPMKQEIIKGLLEDAADPVADAEMQEWMNAPMGKKDG